MDLFPKVIYIILITAQLVLFICVMHEKCNLSSNKQNKNLPKSDYPWAWRCVSDRHDAKCVKERNTGAVGQTTLASCKLTCGKYGALFPYPTKVKLSKSLIEFSPKNIRLQLVETHHDIIHLIGMSVLIFRDNIMRYHPMYNEDKDLRNFFNNNSVDHKMLIKIITKYEDKTLTLETNESYSMNVSTIGKKTNVSIRAITYFGARHALETLSQLLTYDEMSNKFLIIRHARIYDEPKFKYRGIILDTGRNFYSVKSLKRIIDGMSYNKLNTFHWHITESQSFPIEITSLPNMTKYGAYSPSSVYTASDIRHIVEYARIRGVRVLPEMDAPAHVGHGWEWSEETELGKLVVCLNKQPWQLFCAEPPCGQLNIANKNIYKVLQKIYQEYISLFGKLDMFHFGGDEIFINCWNTTREIRSWLTENGKNLSKETYYDEWGMFQENAYKLLTEARGKIIPGIMWTSELTHADYLEKYLDKNKYIIQIWTKGISKMVSNILNKGYKVIFSNYDKLYLDCGFASWLASGNNWCSPYKGWQEIYDNDILSLAKILSPNNSHVEEQVLGGEAAAWSEQIDEYNIDAKLWPRASALAERLWSNPSSTYKEAVSRILEQRKRMVRRGIQAERLQPEWCRQNDRECAMFK